MYLFLFLFLRVPLTKTDYIDTSEKQKVSKHDLAWYYIHYPERFTLNNLINQFGISMDTILVVSKNIISAELTHQLAQRLSTYRDFWVRKIPSRHKIEKSPTGYYSVLCPSTCKLPGKVITRTDFYAVIKYSDDPEKLAKTTCARMFLPYTNRLDLRARFHAGLMSSYSDIYGSEWNQTFESIRILKNHNITGFEQCLTIIDSGIDEKNPWLTKPNMETDSKIYTTLNIADNEDDYEGHGTFVAGIAAGKAHCSAFAASFNGVAEDARIYVVDIKEKGTGKLKWPENFFDTFEPAENLKCPIILNAWTLDDPLLTTAIDIVAYKNPRLLLVFPALRDKDGGIVAPGGAKNILSVGGLFGHPVPQSFIKTDQPVTVLNLNTNEQYIGYTDPSGIPLLNTTYSRDPLQLQSSIGYKATNIHILNDTATKSTVAVGGLIFHDEPLKTKFKFPVIRLSPSKRKEFKEGDFVRIIPSPLGDESETGFGIPDNSSGIFNKFYPYYAKPELSAPSGPMLGPKAGSTACSIDGLTIKEGPSVASALIAGAAVLTRQILQTEFLKGMRYIYSSAIRATLIAAADAIHSPNKTGPADGAGFGFPQLEKLLPIKGNEKSLHILHNLSIESDQRLDFCFKAEREGLVKVALVWHDYPRDPRSKELLTMPLHLNVATDEYPHMYYLGNNEQDDQPTLDSYNTAQRVIIKAKKGMKMRLTVVSGTFSVNAPCQFSLAFVGNISWAENQKCDGYFVAGNCPRECRGRGSLCRQNKLCQCSNDRGGDFCEFRADKLDKDKTVTIQLSKRFEWSIFKFVPDTWKAGMAVQLNINGLDPNKVGFMMNTGKAPTFENHVCADDYCPWAKFDGNSWTFKYEDWEFITKHSGFFFGFYLKTKVPHSFSIDIKLLGETIE